MTDEEYERQLASLTNQKLWLQEESRRVGDEIFKLTSEKPGRVCQGKYANHVDDRTSTCGYGFCARCGVCLG